MKKNIFQLNNISKKFFLLLWLAFHIGIILFFCCRLVLSHGDISIDSDLFNLVPKSFGMESVKKADEKMLSITGQNLFILFENDDFDEAKNVADVVYRKLLESDNFVSVDLYNDMSTMADITDFLYKYRWNLLDADTVQEFNNLDGVESFANNALAQAYGGFLMLPLDNLETDPFLLTEYNLQSYLSALEKSGTAMSVKDGVLASNQNEKWYVMLRCVLSEKGATLASNHNGVSEIYKLSDEFEKNGTRFIYSGTPFHSQESSSSAAKEATIIATISLLIVIIILILIFRSGKPLIYSVCSILISITVAFLSTLAVFGHMHVITLVFGTSLIGSCIDYSLHFFTHWAGNRNLNSGIEIRNHIFPGLSMAIISTCICFAILLFAPFALLKQMSLFCLIGLISSFLTTISIYPYVNIPNGNRKLICLNKFSVIFQKLENRRIGRIVICLMFVFAITSIIVCHKNVKIENNLLSLYEMDGRLLENEITAEKILQYSPSGWFMISDETEEGLLEKEEAFRRDFEELTDGKLGYISPTLFVPSIKRQKESREACKKLLELSEYQFEALGIEKEYSINLKNDFYESEDDFISFEKNNVPEVIKDAVSMAWLGEIDGKYYSVLLPNRVDNYDIFKELADSYEDVFFLSKSVDISRDLDKLTIMILKFFLCAYIVMFVVLKIFYNWKQSLKIISVPLLIILVTVSVFAISGIYLDFFSVTGLILVFGLGLDYIIYMMENEKNTDSSSKVIEPFATMLSFVTTIISFGALALSSFRPVHLIGLAIFIGLTTAYISSFFYGRVGKSENFTKDEV